MTHKIYAIVGLSGSGKSTLAQGFTEHLGIEPIVSFTTRKPRPGEIDGKDYYFLISENIEDLKAEDNIFELTEFHGNQYGSTIDEIEERLSQSSVPFVVDTHFFKDVEVVQKENQTFYYYKGFEIEPVILDFSLEDAERRIVSRSGDLNDPRIENLPQEYLNIQELLEEFPEIVPFEINIKDSIEETWEKFHKRFFETIK